MSRRTPTARVRLSADALGRRLAWRQRDDERARGCDTGAWWTGRGRGALRRLGSFYAHCFRIINQCPLVRRLNSADRDDCVQEVMMEVVRKLGQRQPGENEEGLTGWIRVVSRNKAVDITRRRIRKSEVAFQDGAGAAIIAQPADSPEAMKEGDSLSLLWEALLTLDEEVTMSSYVIFYLRTIERWSIADIAQVFNLSPEHARVRCHRVKKRFGTIVKARGGSDKASPSDSEAEKPAPKRRKRPRASGGPS